MESDRSLKLRRSRAYDEGGKAVEEAAAWHTVGIISNDGHTLGTGSVIRWRTSHLILTAGHVIKDFHSDDLRFFFRPAADLITSDITELDSTDRKLPSAQIHIGRIVASEKVDLAAITVASDLDHKVPIRFFDNLQNSPRAETGQIVLYFGFPQGLVQQLDTQVWAVRQVIQWNELKEPRTLVKFDPSKEFLIGTSLNPQAIDLGGFSGAGVWINQKSGKLWHSNLGLCGVITDVYPQSRLFCAVRADVVRDFLETSPLDALAIKNS